MPNLITKLSVVLKLKHVDRWTDRVHICKQFMHIVQNVHSKANCVKISALNAKLNRNKSTHNLHIHLNIQHSQMMAYKNYDARKEK